MGDTTTGDDPPLSGDLRLLPFLSDPLPDAVAPIYADLAAEHGAENVLVVKRFPTGIDDLESALADETDGVTQPRVTGLAAHTRRVLEELPDTPRVLTPAEQGLLLEAFAAEFEWESPYLERASAHESFVPDLGRFVAEATWQGSSIETADEHLSDLARFNRSFHEWLGRHGLLDPGNVLTTVVDSLRDDSTRDRIQRSFDAVLALEFEEFTRVDRRYLAWLTRGVDLVCVAERESAIQRPWNEPGRIEDHVPDLETNRRSDGGARSLPSAVASFLATGERPDSTGDGTVTVLESPTFEAQVRRIADEIELLRRREGIQYDDVAVVLQDSKAPIPETLRLLQNAGIPVTSATVGGLEHDPAARELYAVVSWCAGEAEPDVGWTDRRARALLQARTDDATAATLDEVARLGDEDSLEDALWHWCVESDLKGRVADDETPLEAKTQFEHVREVLSLAGFVDESPLLDATWEALCGGLEREMRRAAADRLATELDVPADGVLVDTVRVVKNCARDTAFLVNVVDRDYPADPRFTSLFPTPQLERLAGYPSFTTATEADVRETFATETELTTRPLHAYYAALSRRFLGVGARAATNRLYFGTYLEEAGGTGSNLQPSRFLAAAEDAFGPFDRLEHDGVHSHGSAVEFALTRSDRALDEIRRAGVVGDPVDVTSVAADFATVQTLLDGDLPPEVAEAIRTRVDLARGVVHRE
ncbi:hypothetical protein [Haloarchaeobius sp. HRN-SO-5]|uniref:hypothetical protein n=1 Tax=Haloarchaeobius sp. HRN-SO-5 TaxID=3446118 RepID=UPI003EB9C618